MTTDLKQCPVEGCPEMIKLDKNLCRRHWFSLPKPVRDEHMATYREFLDARRDLRSDRSRYRMACKVLSDSVARTTQIAQEAQL